MIFVCVYRRQDEELDEPRANLQRIGGVGLTIHEELVGQVPSNIIRKIYRFVFPFILFVSYLVELKPFIHAMSSQLHVLCFL
jgi:hypothetical protein